MLCNNDLVSALNTMADNKALAKKNTKATVNKMVCTQLVLLIFLQFTALTAIVIRF